MKQRTTKLGVLVIILPLLIANTIWAQKADDKSKDVYYSIDAVKKDTEAEFGHVKVQNLRTGAIVCTAKDYDNDFGKYLIIHRLKYFPPGVAFSRDQSIQTQIFEVNKQTTNNEQIVTDEFNLYGAYFSPNGKYILLKDGNQSSFNGPHYLYVFDIESRKVVSMCPDVLANEMQAWSPDSNYVAYIHGGDALGNPYQNYGPYEFESPLSLRVWDWRTGEIINIKNADTLPNFFQWIEKNTLVYSYYNASKTLYQIVEEKLKSDKLAIEKYDVSLKKTTQLNITGYFPTISPNSKKVVFWGSEDPQKPVALLREWSRYPGVLTMCVADVDGTNFKSIHLWKGSYPTVLWRPDNRHFITINSGELSDGHSVGEIREWDIETGKFRFIARIYAEDAENLHRALISPNFKALTLDKTGNSLIMRVDEMSGRYKKANYMAKSTSKIISVDIASGNISIIAEMPAVFSANWAF